MKTRCPEIIQTPVQKLFLNTYWIGCPEIPPIYPVGVYIGRRFSGHIQYPSYSLNFRTPHFWTARRSPEFSQANLFCCSKHPNRVSGKSVSRLSGVSNPQKLPIDFKAELSFEVALNHVRAISEGREHIARQIPITPASHQSAQSLVKLPALPALPAVKIKRGPQPWTTHLTRWQKWRAYRSEQFGVDEFELRRQEAARKKAWRDARKAKAQ